MKRKSRVGFYMELSQPEALVPPLLPPQRFSVCNPESWSGVLLLWYFADIDSCGGWQLRLHEAKP